MAEIILFDLDGTLTDPCEGITKCVQYGMKALGYQEPSLEKLTPFIGPPLHEMFMEYCGFTSSQADLAVEKYRERFREKGMFENRIYPGIPELLEALTKAGKRLGVATSKPWVYAEPILSHFGIRGYFEYVTGSELNGERVDKSEVIEEAVRRFGCGKNGVIMIGDRKYDILGARKAGVDVLGVTYGYGSREELLGAGARKLAGSVSELASSLLEVEV